MQLRPRSVAAAPITILCAALLLLSACAPGGPTARATPTATPTATQVPLPSPVAGLLDPPPTNCPASPPLQTLSFASFGGYIPPVVFHGSGPVWLGEYNLAGATLNLDFQGPTPWPGTKILWEVGPNYQQPVTITVTNLATSQLAYWSHDNPPPQSVTTALVLDPQHPTVGVGHDHGAPEPGWHEWGSLLYILSAGCYEARVTWQGGSWGAIFAAGR
jgi:hypothetical protein